MFTIWQALKIVIYTVCILLNLKLILKLKKIERDILKDESDFEEREFNV